MNYPKRLIEVDLPIKLISEHARREKSIRHGHISTLHIWWARRPLAACRAVLCAALWPDPADENCPPAFKVAASEILCEFARQVRDNGPTLAPLCGRHWKEWQRFRSSICKEGSHSGPDIRYFLLAFIANFANWNASTNPVFLETARALTQAAYESLGGIPGTRPHVVDPFAGGGAIPLEALRVGADSFASDLNPVAILLNKVVLEYIPRYGQRLADEVRKWGHWIKEQAEQELAEFYPKDPDGATPIAYLWARTITCEGPGCGTEVPLMRSFWLAKKSSKAIALRIVPNPATKCVDFEIIEDAKARDVGEGTVRRGSAECPVCGYTTPVASVRRQLKERRGGAADARLFAVVTTHSGEQGRFYRLPTREDLAVLHRAEIELQRRKTAYQGVLSLVPDEPLPPRGTLGFRVQLYGMEQWGDLFSPRQMLTLTTLARLVREVKTRFYPLAGSSPNGSNDEQALAAVGAGSARGTGVVQGAELVQVTGSAQGTIPTASVFDSDFARAVQTCLALAINRQADYLTSLTIWANSGEFIAHTFGRQALPIVWEWPECQVFGDGSGNWMGAINWISLVIESLAANFGYTGRAECATATQHILADGAAHALITDPPYYDAIPYADLSDFFYVWFKRTIGDQYPDLFSAQLTPKDEECVVDEVKGHDKAYFEKMMSLSLAESCRLLIPGGICVVVFAHQSTTSWETLLQAMIDTGWTITGSWPIDTERPGRLRAHSSSALASSIHLVCRPRKNPDGSLRIDDVGDWRDVLQELPKRMREWMPRLAKEGIVGADAIFSCLGPALEIFSRYSYVERADGERVTLKEYLEYVWAAVSREALNTIFQGADTSGFEADARLTAMWLWTLSTSDEKNSNENGKKQKHANDTPALVEDASTDYVAEDVEEEEEDTGPKPGLNGYALEFDTARKIAQGLGAHLAKLGTLVEIKGGTARLRSLQERARFLFHKGANDLSSAKPRRTGKIQQLSMFQEQAPVEEFASMGEVPEFNLGSTVLDRLHQAMLLYGAGNTDSLRHFLKEEGAGTDPRFWKLAAALSSLYPPRSDERRWVNALQQDYKKGMGL